MSSRGNIIIVADLENFCGCINADPALTGCSMSLATRASASAIRRRVSQQYPDCQIQWQVSAFSFPEPGSEAYREQVSQIARAAREANQLGYQVLTVKRGENTADYAITELASALLFDRRIKICILATQDSGADFVSFINTVRQRTEIHLIGYDYIPESFRTEDVMPSSLLKGDITEIVQQMRPRVQASHPRPADTLQQSTRKFLNNPDSLNNSTHRAWIAQAISGIRSATEERPEGTFRELITGVRSRWQGPFPPDRELGDMLNVLIDRFFSRRHILVYQPGTMILFLARHPNLKL